MCGLYRVFNLNSDFVRDVGFSSLLETRPSFFHSEKLRSSGWLLYGPWCTPFEGSLSTTGVTFFIVFRSVSRKGRTTQKNGLLVRTELGTLRIVVFTDIPLFHDPPSHSMFPST